MINICINIINREFKFHITAPGNATLEEHALCKKAEALLRKAFYEGNVGIDDSAIDVTPKKRLLKGPHFTDEDLL